MQQKNKYKFFVKVFAVFLIILISIQLIFVFILRPIWIGYSIYKETERLNLSIAEYSKNLEELESKILVSETNLSVCYAFSKEILSQLKNLTTELIESETQITSLKNELERAKTTCDEETEEIQEELSNRISELDQLRQDYDSLVRNTANNLCCKARVDNPRIRYYTVENNRVICLEQGTKEISCS